MRAMRPASRSTPARMAPMAALLFLTMRPPSPGSSNSKRRSVRRIAPVLFERAEADHLGRHQVMVVGQGFEDLLLADGEAVHAGYFGRWRRALEQLRRHVFRRDRSPVRGFRRGFVHAGRSRRRLGRDGADGGGSGAGTVASGGACCRRSRAAGSAPVRSIRSLGAGAPVGPSACRTAACAAASLPEGSALPGCPAKRSQRPVAA